LHSTLTTASSTSTTCVTCNAGFVLAFDDTQCVPAIRHCASYDSLNPSDQILKCAACVSGWEVTSDKLACLPQISN
jgi:hypothetical protein